MDQSLENTPNVKNVGQWQELAEILRTEWQGAAIDRRRAQILAGGLLPHHPELRNTLTHIQNRMATARH